MSSDTSTGTAAEAASGEHDDPILGKTIDGCKVIRKLGQGGMGVVYLAEHETLGQEFVLKILNPALTGAEDTVERFFREAQACAQLNHPGIVAIQNVGQESEYYYIRMEYVKGDTLEALIKDQRQIEWRDATQKIVDVADALSHAHQKGMIHRDIKPENIMVTPKGEVKVMDFGLAKHVHSSAKVSVTGQIVGTPFFMSPEQAGGKPTDARSDIYSLGVTLYYLVTGVKPFNGKNLQEIFLKHFFYAPESPKIYNDALPESFCEVIKRCLKKKKKERYQSAKALAQDLRSVLDNPDAPLPEQGAARAAPPPSGVGMAEGDKTIATGPTGGDGDRTVQVQSNDDGGDRTVQVQSNDDGGDRTVQVQGNDGSDRTVQVGGGGGGRDTGAVNFASASMVFNPGDEATIQVDDEEDAHAGLDLPTSVINAAKAGGDFTLPGAEVEEPEDPEALAAAAAARKKKMMVIGAVVLIPALFFGIMQVSARAQWGGLTQRYNELNDAGGKPTKELVEKWRAMATDFKEFHDGQLLAPNLTPEAGRMAETCSAEADRLEKRYKDELRSKQELEKQAEREKQRQKDWAVLKVEVDKKLDALAKLTQKKDASSRHWKDYTEQVILFLEEHRKLQHERFPELKPLLDALRVPVRVTSDPGNAQVFVGDSREPSKELTPPNGSGLVWVQPSLEFSIRVVRRGFQEWRSKPRSANRFWEIDTALSRKLIREPFILGEIKTVYGPAPHMQPLTPIHEPEQMVTPNGQCVLYFVGQGGHLRAYRLERPGQLEWPRCPGGGDCRGKINGETVEEIHRIGLYGDPIPGIHVGEEVILAGSLLGFISAHERARGKVIWRTDLRSPVTSPPRYLSGNVVAAGTAAGEVVFLDQSGRILWRHNTDNRVVSAPYLFKTQCVVGSTDDKLYLLDWKLQKRLDRLDLGSDIVCGPTPSGRSVLVGTASGQVHVVDLSKPGRLRLVRTLGPEAKGAPVRGMVLAEVGGKPAVFFSAGKSLHAYDLDGKPLWARGGKAKPFFSPRGDLTAPVLQPEGDLLYAGGGSGGVLYALDRKTGQERWRFLAPKDDEGRSGSIDLAPFLFANELFVVSGRKVYVLDPE